jgi:hypothetical protein
MQQSMLQGPSPSLANLLQTPETQSLNLTVLRRIDSAITQVLRSSQVCETARVTGDSAVSQVPCKTLRRAKPNNIMELQRYAAGFGMRKSCCLVRL